jgi:uncharacterized repeat protein (TIGR03987 family)
VNPTLIKAVIVVTFALLFYSIAVVMEQRKSEVSRRVLFFLTVGICLDISSTVLMIVGSGNMPLTVHGVIGYSALLAMLIDTALIWRFWVRNRDGSRVPRRLNLYTRVAFGWWVVAYIAGAIISMTLSD